LTRICSARLARFTDSVHFDTLVELVEKMIGEG